MSKGSISAMTRLLTQSGSIEVVAVPGSRATCYRLSPDGLERKFIARMQGMVGFRTLAEQGLELLGDAPAEHRERLEKVASLYAFLDRELPALVARWKQEQQDG